MQKRIQSAIHHSYYALLFLVPLAMFHKTSELFEFNKMIVVYIFTTVILFFWVVNSVIRKKIIFKRTFLDIPLALFLLSQFLSTITSINTRASFLGYYSRFNGGLISVICFSILYWGFVSNFNKDKTLKAIYATFISALLVSVYAVLQHFGIDAHIWVQDVQNRVFSTLGQPNWLAAFIIVVTPITWALTLTSKFKPDNTDRFGNLKSKILNLSWTWIILSSVFYSVLIYTKSRSGFVGFAALTTIFWGLILIRAVLNKKTKKDIIYKFLIINLVVFLLTAYNGTPWTPNISQIIKRNNSQPQSHTTEVVEEKYQGPLLEVGGSSSTEIRKIVWTGTIDIWKNYPILGTGVETFAYSYYNFRPLEHNLVSEWDFLYNKAHNEYLNFAATTGSLGIGAYLVLIFSMAFVTLRNSKTLGKFKSSVKNLSLLHFSFLSGLISIYVTNFFGFSVVPVNLIMFMLPAFSIGITKKDELVVDANKKDLDSSQKSAITITGIVAIFMLIVISRYWYADYLYGQGKAYNDIGNFVSALNYLDEAVLYSKNEPVIWNELSEANLNMGLRLAEAEDERALHFIEGAIQASNTAVKLSEKDVNIRRKRASMYIKLSSFDPSQLLLAREELLKAIELAPTDAKLWYNLGLVYARGGDFDTARKTLDKTIEMKPDYVKARYAYALLLLEMDEKEKALEQANFILENIDPNYKAAQQLIEENE